MKSIKLAKFSLAELHEQHDAQKREFEALRLAETQNIYSELSALAQLMGIPLRQLVERSLMPGDKPLPVFYVNPENVAQQWHGRGAKPKWLREWLAAGKSLDQVLI
jgi:DNA-binding protein H-NS